MQIYTTKNSKAAGMNVRLSKIATHLQNLFASSARLRKERTRMAKRRLLSKKTPNLQQTLAITTSNPTSSLKELRLTFINTYWWEILMRKLNEKLYRLGTNFWPSCKKSGKNSFAEIRCPLLGVCWSASPFRSSVASLVLFRSCVVKQSLWKHETAVAQTPSTCNNVVSHIL